MKLLSKLAFSAAALFLSTSAMAAQPPWVTIQGITYAGTGCPAGSVSQNISNDYKAFTLLFDEYVVEAGPGVSRREGRKACQINVDMQFPQGWSYSIMDVDYRGYVSLDRGVTGVAQSDYYFQGQRGSARLSTTFRGPIDQDYEYRDSLGISAVVWSPCGASRSLNMKTQIRVDNNRARRGTGLLTVDSVDGQLEQVYGIQWRRCR